MHIARTGSTWAHTLGLITNPLALCGARIAGAERQAPLCQICFQLSGWTHDKRH
ncbi:hypothetical protein LV78_001308 [Actinosynnema pretiosum]|nr:hypothetical protein [Actinosynnema pretiosum]